MNNDRPDTPDYRPELHAPKLAFVKAVGTFFGGAITGILAERLIVNAWRGR
jgi:hypothetical protein